jgi:hypothetical protein
MINVYYLGPLKKEINSELRYNNSVVNWQPRNFEEWLPGVQVFKRSQEIVFQEIPDV